MSARAFGIANFWFVVNNGGVTSLAGNHVFLSASFPSGDRGKKFEPYSAGAIADAVSAVVRAVLRNEGKLLFGGHPTITPMVLLIGCELEVQDAVDVFQSKWFEGSITEETHRLTESGVGEIHWTEKRDTLPDSLELMREEMFSFGQPAGAVFVGGMEGIPDEHEMFGRRWPGVPRVPLAAPGGAAANLEIEGLPEELAEQVASRHYPLVASLIVEALAAG